MSRRELEQIKPEELVDEVMRVLSSRLKTEMDYSCGGQSGSNGTIMVLGKLPQEAERTLSSCYTLVPFSETTDFTIFVAAQLSVKTMAFLGSGLFGDGGSAVMLRGLLEGKRVYILEDGMEYLAYKESAHKNLYRMYQECEENVMRTGARIILDAADIMEMNGKDAKQSCAVKAESIRLQGRRLLRESDLIKAHVPGCITVVLDKNTIITPLAMDYITNHNLAVKRQ